MKSKSLLLLAPLMIAALAGCSGNGGGGGGGGGGGSDTYTIRFWHNCNDSNTAMIEEAARAFEQANPGITIEAPKISASYAQLRDNVINGIPANDYPDIFYGYPDSVQAINEYGVIAKLDSLVDDPEIGWSADKKKDVIEAYVNEGKSYPTAGLYSLPFSKSTEVMCWNQGILDGLNLSNEDPTINGGEPLNKDYFDNLTWEELFDKLCPALLKNKTVTDYLDMSGNYAIFAYDSDANWFITLAEQYGYGYTGIDSASQKGTLLFDNQNMRDLVLKYKGYYDKHYFQTQGTSGAYTSNMFVARQALFTVSSTAGVAANCTKGDFAIELSPVPHAAGKDAKVINQGPSVALLSHKDNNRLKWAWKFYNYFLDNYSLAWSINTTYLPVLNSQYNSPEYIKAKSTTGKTNPSSTYAKAQIFNYIPTVSDTLFSSVVFKGSDAARDEVGALFTTAMTTTGSTTPESIQALFTTAINNTKNKM